MLEVVRSIKDPGMITSAVAWVLGHVINFFFLIIYNIGIHAHSLGFAIILLTIFTRLLMTPLAYKQQKSTFKMQALSPEIKRIQAKYKGSTSDPELARKMQMETQKLYQDNNVSPFSGCLPLLIQLPIFIGLYHVMQNPFKYIDIINDIYTQFSNIVLTMASSSQDVKSLVLGFAGEAGVEAGVEINAALFNKIINVLSPTDINSLKVGVASIELNEIYELKLAIETFFGLNLTERIGLSFGPKLIIPIISGGTTFLSTWLMNRKNKTDDPAMQSQQRIMNVTMPLMMAWITTTLPAGIGIYWITGNFCQIIQSLILNNYFSKSGDLDIIVPKEKKGGKK